MFKVGYIHDVTGIERDELYDAIEHEIEWRDDVKHLGGNLPRRFALQGCITNGLVPLYRHPMDDYVKVSSYTPFVNRIRKQLEEVVGHELNHAIIQLYRNGKDHITEHADKTLDIVPGSKIVNFSIGEPRLMRFRAKCMTETYTGGFEYDKKNYMLEHDSALILDLETNQYYKHKISKQASISGSRISITFRHIGTFVDSKGNVSGQGAPKGVGMSKEELLTAFGKENHSTIHTWEELYGRGFAGSY
jgi:hypothetical protein